MKKYPFVFIEWVDAQSDCDWDSPEKVKEWANKDCIIYESGWLICENEKYLVISNQIGEDGDLGNRTKIPVKWITKRTDIKKRIPNVIPKKKNK